jgi:tetratricopeptide (TPR) repeat protein
MAKEDNTNTEIQDLPLEELKSKANNIFEENKIAVFGLLGVAIVLFLGIYWYTQIHLGPREDAAQIELYKANQFMNRDSFTLALTGRNVKGQASNFIGYVGIITDYSGTNASNLAHYYAGVASLRLTKPDLALDYLKNFSGEELLQTQAYNMMGDAASELGDFDQALEYYQDAASNTSNMPLKIYSMYKFAKLSEHQGKVAEAKKMFEEIMNKDSKIAESLGVDKDLIRLK